MKLNCTLVCNIRPYKALLLAVMANFFFLIEGNAQLPIAYFGFETSANGPFAGSGTAAQLAVNSGCSYQKTGTGTLSNVAGNGKYLTYGGPNDGQAASLAGWPSSTTRPTNQTNSYEYTVSTTGLTTITMSFDYKIIVSLFGTLNTTLSYSTNGGTSWTQLGNAITTPFLTNTWLQSSSFSLPVAAENISNLKVRIYGYNSNATTNQLVIDNVTFYAASTRASGGTKTSIDERSLYNFTTSGGTGIFSRTAFTVANGSELIMGSDILALGTFAVSNGGTLTFGTGASPKYLIPTFSIFGWPLAGTLTTSSGSRLKITSPDGINTVKFNGTETGNVQLLTRTYDPGANYDYIGASPQVTGDGLPTTMTGGDLTINNTYISGTATAVTLSQSTTLQGSIVSGFLYPTSGIFGINSGITFTKTSANGITIQNASGIKVNGGTFITGNGTITNNGLFQVLSGTATIGNSSGNSLSTATGGTFDMQGGAFTVAGRLENTAGTAKITGGTVTVNTVGNTATTGSFDMSLSTNLTISGTPVIYFQNASTGGKDLYILNSTGIKSITGGKFQFGNGSTPTNQIFQCYSAGTNTVSLYNVTVNDINSPNANLQSDITVTGTLTLNSTNTSGAFLINGKTLTVNQVTGSGKLTGSQQSGLVVTGSTAQTLRFTANVFPGATTNNYLKTFTLNSSTNVTLADSLSIAANLFLNPGVVKVSGTLNTAGLLTLKSDASGDAMVGQSSSGTVINGEVMLERYIPGRRAWRFLSVPFTSSTQSIRDAWQEGATPNQDIYTRNDPKPGYGTQITYWHGSQSSGFDENLTANPSLYSWDPAAGTIGDWSAISSTNNSLTAKNAYYLFIRGDRSINLSLGTGAGYNSTILRSKGVLNENAGSNITYNLGDYSAGRRLLVANPFASSVDLSTVLSRAQNNITPNKFWAWDPTFSFYSYPYNVGYYITYVSGIQVPFGNYQGSKYAQSGQAFMVESAGTGSASITFKQTDKVGTGIQVFGLQSAEKKPAAVPVIYTNLINPALDLVRPVDGVGTGFGRQYSDSVTREDAGKMWNQNESMALWRHNQPLAIEFRPIPKQTDTLFYKMYLYMQPYILKIFSANLPGNLPAEAWLVDKYLGTQTAVDLYDTTWYSFTPNPDTNSYRNRFMLVFNRTGKKGPVAGAGNTMMNVDEGADVKIYPNPATANQTTLQLNGMEAGNYEIAIYNAKGERMATRSIQHSGGSNSYTLILNSLWASGVYTVQVNSKASQKTITVKLVISR